MAGNGFLDGSFEKAMTNLYEASNLELQRALYTFLMLPPFFCNRHNDYQGCTKVESLV